MRRCPQTTALVELVASGQEPDGAQRAHLEVCDTCRSATEAARGFDLLLRSAARSIASEAEVGFAAEPVAIATAVWAKGSGIDQRAFERLEVRGRHLSRIGAVMGGVAAGVVLAVAGLMLEPSLSGPSTRPVRRPVVAVVDQVTDQGAARADGRGYALAVDPARPA